MARKPWTGSVSQPRKGETPSQHVKRLVKEGVAAKDQPVPVPAHSTDPIVAYGPDCPACKGRKACGQCGYRP